MRSQFFITAALVGLLIVPTVAPKAEQSGAAQPLSTQRGAFSNATHASDIIGKSAYGANGESIGSINDLLINARGQVEAAVVDVGGFLGMGQHTVAINWDQMKVNASDNRVTISMTKDQLKAAPEYKKSAQANVPSDRQQSQVPEKSKSTSPMQ